MSDVATALAPEPGPAEPGPGCLLVTSIFPPIRGGSAVVYDNLGRYSGGRVAVLAPYRHYQTGHVLVGWRDHDKAAPYPIYRIELLRPREYNPTSKLQSLWRYVRIDVPLKFRILWKIRNIVLKEKIKILCIGELNSGSWIGPYAKLLWGCKIINYIHGEEVTSKAQYTFFGRSKEKYLNRADAVVAVSNFTRQALIGLTQTAPAKIEVIYNGVDLDRFRITERNPQLVAKYRLAGKRVLLSVGRLVPRKGIDRTIEAMPRLLRRYPDLHYLVVGDGPYRGQLQQMVAGLDLGRHVTFTGPIDDDELRAHYALCDVFVLPNREMPDGDTEGFGLVFLEANACGKPVVGGRAGGVVEAVKDGANGLLVDGESADSIAAAIERLLDDRTLYARLRQGGLEISHRSSWQLRTQQFQALCQRLG
jgi:phosphatidylinositol alpha-1,6-mannosyltransferase